MMPTRAEAEKILEEAEQCNSWPLGKSQSHYSKMC